MNAGPPPYNTPSQEDEDEAASKWPIRWGWIQSCLVLVSLAIAIAVLAINVRDRGFGYKAFDTADTAEGTASKAKSIAQSIAGIAQDAKELAASANGTAMAAKDIVSHQVSCRPRLVAWPNAFQFDELAANVSSLQQHLVNLTDTVKELGSKIEEQAAKTSSKPSSTSASAAPSGSGSSWEGRSSRILNSPKEALGWIVVETVVVLFL
jgi:hypothetical protein